MSKNLMQMIGADMRDLGEGLICVEVAPVYVYENRQKTDKVDGVKILVACPNLKYEKVAVKLPALSLSAAEALIGKTVKFEGLTGHFYVIDGKIGLTASAKVVKAVA